MENFTGVVNFDKQFRLMIFAMRVNRSHPDITRDRKWACQFLAMHGLFFLIFCLLIYSIIFHDLQRGDFTQACANGVLCVVFNVVSFKYCVLLWYQDLIKGLMEEMKVDYAVVKRFSLAEQQIVRNYANKGKKVVDLWLIISTAAGGLFILKALLLMTYSSVKGDFKLIHLYDLTYPSSVEQIKNEPAVYFLISAVFLFYDGYAVIMYIAMAALGPVFMLHGCGQLEIMKERLMNVFNERDSDKTTLEKLNDIVIHLQKIYSFLERIKESFKVLYELTLKATAIILPITFYQVIESFRDGALRVEFITFIIGGITLSSIPCYYSDKLMDMGENLRLAVYMCGWEAHLEEQKLLRSTLLLVHARAARPVAIRTMIRTVSLDALTDVYHQSYAIFNVLNAAPRR